MALTLTINGATRIVDAPADMPLLWVLRDVIKLKGTKYGCGIAACGACTVLIDGEPVRSCVMAAGDVAGAILTVEGLSGQGLAEGDVLTAVQQAWVELNVAQCGYCQSGQIMAATALLAGTPDPDDAEVTEAMDGNLCRCGTYPKIRAAIARASALLKDGA